MKKIRIVLIYCLSLSIIKKTMLPNLKKKRMKNCLGKEGSLELFNKDGNKVYWFNTDSNGYSCERTYDENGNELTYTDSDGLSIGFDIPEYTMEELVLKLGNFKIKK